MRAGINTKKTLHKGKVFSLVSENITLANGLTVDMDVIRHPGASAIVPFRGRDTLILIRQYRHAIGDHIWEIPAGTLDPGETPIDCAKRELIEETGYSAENWQTLGEITPVPGYSDERVHLFMATGLTPAQQKLDPDEILDVQEVKLSQAVEMVYCGKIQDGKTISALFLIFRKIKTGKGPAFFP